MAMRPVALLWAVATIALLAGCAGTGGASGGAVRFVTPAPTPTATAIPTATPTPLPPAELLVSTTATSQAGAILISVTGGVIGGTVTFAGQTYGLIRGTESMFTYVPLSVDAETGTFPLTAAFTRSDGSTGSLSSEITVSATSWTSEVLEFDPELEPLFDPAVESAEEALLVAQYDVSTPEKLWDTWVQPVGGALTSEFGEQRAVNGGEPDGHHSGTDFGAEEGTPVVASSSGRVVYTGTLDIRGNMVIIDHGGGVLSGYAHLSAFSVAVGDTVETGQQIGAVGSTGRSTGAHLHWEMVVHGVIVDPLRFVNGVNGF